MATLQDILIDSYAYTDLLAEVPASSELSLRTLFAKRAVDEWSQAYKWRQLKTEYIPSLGTFASLSITNFTQLDGPPMEFLYSGTYEQYPEIQPADRFSKDTDEKYCYITGSDGTGFSIHVNGIGVNATLSIQYVRGASTMATLTDVCEVPDPQFVTNRVISYVLQARNDDRFPVVLAEGNRLLKNMISQEMIRLPGGTNSTPKKGVAGYSIGG